jgi:CDGSH-type Zn-finger protein/truncated hemoglobin YjbI
VSAAHGAPLELSELYAAVQATRDELARVAAPITDSDAEHDRLGAAVERLDNSVLRPLGDVLDARSGPAGPVPGRVTPLWQLAEQATALRAAADPPHELLEATAALQDLAVGFPAEETEAGTPEDRLVRLREMLQRVPADIQPSPDGPYLVTNGENLRDHLGCKLPSRPQMALCRCGQSAMKPYCDGSHARVGFTDDKSPDRAEDRRDGYIGQQVTVLDNRAICQHSAFCTDRLATVFRLREEPFVHPSGGRMDEIIRAVRDCPSGALSYAIDDVEARDAVDYHGKREPTIEVTQDGPYRITGGLPLHTVQGEPVDRNEGASLEHYALCRCGQSQNKPFCSGMHWYVDFHDPVPEPDRTPTMFEWAGGLPALQRMTRLFYEKYVPQDPMLAPLFANMSTDHPQRVAKWLGEVFGGPKLYSDEYGGYPRMLSQHIGKGITEDWRARWVSLLLQSAREAGLPNDPEFASGFQAYIEWGSRLAVENSQTTSKPPERMPMPHWDWTTSAGRPGGRLSALAPPADEPEEPIVLPAADEPVRFEKHIRQLFRSRDRDSMKFAFDLWAYEDVRRHGEAILERLGNGSMPCDGAWPAEHIDVFERWISTGMNA